MGSSPPCHTHDPAEFIMPLMLLRGLPLPVIRDILVAMAFRVSPLIYILVDAAAQYRIDVRPHCSHLYLKMFSRYVFQPLICCVTTDGSLSLYHMFVVMVHYFFCFYFFCSSFIIFRSLIVKVCHSLLSSFLLF